jgi:hypothetical protein
MDKTAFKLSLTGRQVTVIDRLGNVATVADLLTFIQGQKDFNLLEIGRETYLVTPSKMETQNCGLEESFIVLLELSAPTQATQSEYAFAHTASNEDQYRAF